MYQKIKYVASDGREFETDTECLEYETSENFINKIYQKIKFYDGQGKRIFLQNSFYTKYTHTCMLKGFKQDDSYKNDIANIRCIAFCVEDSEMDKATGWFDEVYKTFERWNPIPWSGEASDRERVFCLSESTGEWIRASDQMWGLSHNLSQLVEIYFVNNLSIPKENFQEIVENLKIFTDDL